MIFQCPGQDGRRIRIRDIQCPGCRYMVEIFSDELKRRCPQCRKWVYQENLPSCVDWCKLARECIGETRWKELNKGGENVLLSM